jgi:hypothetical protein
MIPRYEQLETVVLCHLQNGTTSGNYGSLTRVPDGYVVSIEGENYHVTTTVMGWRVSRGGLAVNDTSLIEAARTLMNAERAFA